MEYGVGCDELAVCRSSKDRQVQDSLRSSCQGIHRNGTQLANDTPGDINGKVRILQTAIAPHQLRAVRHIQRLSFGMTRTLEFAHYPERPASEQGSRSGTK